MAEVTRGENGHAQSTEAGSSDQGADGLVSPTRAQSGP
jgi:hypothetical protein